MVYQTKNLTNFLISHLKSVLKKEEGAVTADMVMLMAGVVAMGIAIYAVFDPNDPSSPIGWWVFVIDELLRKTIIGYPMM